MRLDLLLGAFKSVAELASEFRAQPNHGSYPPCACSCARSTQRLRTGEGRTLCESSRPPFAHLRSSRARSLIIPAVTLRACNLEHTRSRRPTTRHRAWLLPGARGAMVVGPPQPPLRPRPRVPWCRSRRGDHQHRPCDRGAGGARAGAPGGAARAWKARPARTPRPRELGRGVYPRTGY